MSLVYVLGGANGAGKTTFYETGVKNGYINSSIPFLNVDVVAKQLGGYSETNLLEAEQRVKERMSDLLSRNEDFIIESNLSKQADFDWLEKLNRKGYDLKLDFISSGDIEINKLRVHQRVKEGGHDVPDHIIEQRHTMGVTYLKSKIFMFREARLIDNADLMYKQVAAIAYGKIIKIDTDCPKWAKEILHIAERLAQKNSLLQKNPRQRKRGLRP